MYNFAIPWQRRRWEGAGKGAGDRNNQGWPLKTTPKFSAHLGRPRAFYCSVWLQKHRISFGISWVQLIISEKISKYIYRINVAFYRLCL